MCPVAKISSQSITTPCLPPRCNTLFNHGNDLVCYFLIQIRMCGTVNRFSRCWIFIIIKFKGMKIVLEKSFVSEGVIVSVWARMMWSITCISKVDQHLSFLVKSMSWLLGLTHPEGWLWAIIIEEANTFKAEAKWF